MSIAKPSAQVENVTEKSARQKALAALDNDKSWSWAQWRAVAVAGSGFLTDSYDNFIIGLMVPMIGYCYFDNIDYMGKDNVNQVPNVENGWLKAASSYGNLVGQLTFGILGDLIGRKKIYGIALLILITGALGTSLAAQPMRGISIVTAVAFWRFILGFGVGGDYPVSSVITSEFATPQNRGSLIALVFAMQGVGILLAAGVAVGTVAAMQGPINADQHNLDYVWRFLSAFGCVPAMCAVYYRLTISESPRYTMNVEGNVEQAVADAQNHVTNHAHETVGKAKINPFKAYGHRFITHFSKWDHLKKLIACSMCWFLLDIGYYGTNLNTSIVLKAIGYTDKSTPYNDIYTTCMGQLVIALCGNVPGYYFTVFFVDKWGRKPIQIMGFLVLTACFGVLGFWYPFFSSRENNLYFVIIYSVAQFFFNFGPNSTTFIYPAEVFPTAVRSSAHGLSAATGKLGAIIAAQFFPTLVDWGGKPKSNHFMGPTLLILAALCFLGLLFTFLLPETKGRSLEELNDEEELE